MGGGPSQIALHRQELRRDSVNPLIFPQVSAFAEFRGEAGDNGEGGAKTVATFRSKS